MIVTLKNYFEFFKTTIAINLAASVLPLLFGGLIAFNYSLLSFGLIVSLAVKEVTAKNEYLFYFNNRISKMELWLMSWFFTFIFLIIGIFIFNLIIKLF